MGNANEGSDGREYWREQIDELLRDANLPPPDDAEGFEEPSGDELRAYNLLERAIEPIAGMA